MEADARLLQELAKQAIELYQGCIDSCQRLIDACGVYNVTECAYPWGETIERCKACIIATEKCIEQALVYQKHCSKEIKDTTYTTITQAMEQGRTTIAVLHECIRSCQTPAEQCIHACLATIAACNDAARSLQAVRDAIS